MTRFPIALAVSFLLMLFAEQASAEGRRVALVVGVSAYESVPALPNAVNDSSAMADLFRKAGFDVVTARTDVGNLAFKRSIREFEDAVTEADIAVVYYAGHGIEVRDQNYLIPADAKLANERDVEDEAIALDRIISALEPAKRLRLVILDACRDNPFAGKMKKRVATRAISSGLGKVEPQMSDTLIAYAAKEKAVANDGTGAHSPFTTALLDNLTVPGLDIRLAFGRVRDEVLKATGHQQEPFVYGSLGGGTVALVPAPAVAAPALSTADTAKSDYELVERVGKKEAWEVYLNTHKTGLYADLARVQLAKLAEPPGLVRSDAPASPLDGRTRDAPKVEVPTYAAPPRPTAAEQKAWDKLKASTDQAAIRRFIEKFPSSPLVAEAQERLETLERLARERDEAARVEREAAKQREDEERQKKAAEADRLRLEREAARHREEEERAKAAELARQKAEALAAARQREAEERARVAEALAKQREEEERAKAAVIAERKREAEERARAAEAARQKDLAEAAERRRLADEAAKEAAKVAAAEKAAREAAEKAKAAELAAARRQVEEAARAAELAARKRQAEEQAEAARTAGQKREAEERAKAAELAAKRQAEEAAKAAEIAARKQQAEEKARAAAEAAKQKQAEEQARLAEQKRLADERAKTAEAEREKAKAAESARKRDDDELKAAEIRREKARADADAERRKAAAAARDSADRQAERAAAARKREQAEAAREAAENAAASRRKAAADASRRASERAAAAAAAAEQRRRAARESAKATVAARPARPPRPVAQAAPAPRARAGGGGGYGGGGGGAAPMVGIGF